jgi:hypothetical protein
MYVLKAMSQSTYIYISLSEWFRWSGIMFLHVINFKFPITFLYVCASVVSLKEIISVTNVYCK